MNGVTDPSKANLFVEMKESLANLVGHAQWVAKEFDIHYAHVGEAETLLLRANTDQELKPDELWLLMQLRDDNRHDGARLVITSNQADWGRAMRLSDMGLIAIEQLATGGRLHITRKGAKLLSASPSTVGV